MIAAESALAFGPPEVIGPQVDHLRTLSAEPNVDVLIRPSCASDHPRRGSGFTLLDFDDRDDPSVVYIEVPKGARYFDRPAEVQDYEYVFDLIMSRSIPIEEWEQAR